MEKTRDYEKEKDLNLKATELTLGLPGTEESPRNNKRPLPHTLQQHSSTQSVSPNVDSPSKAKMVGWPPIGSYRRNSMKEEEGSGNGMYVKVSLDGAPYLRKIDLRLFSGYPHLLNALQNMFHLTIGKYCEREGYKGSEYAPTYEDEEGDWMLVGDVPWDLFVSCCKRLRIMKESEAKGLGCSV